MEVSIIPMILFLQILFYLSVEMLPGIWKPPTQRANHLINTRNASLLSAICVKNILFQKLQSFFLHLFFPFHMVQKQSHHMYFHSVHLQSHCRLLSLIYMLQANTLHRFFLRLHLQFRPLICIHPTKRLSWEAPQVHHL